MSALAINPSTLEQIFNITRSTELKEVEKREGLAKLIKQSGQSITNVAKAVYESDRTGHREVIGNITRLTGHALSDLGFTGSEITILKTFGNVHRSGNSIHQWNTLLEQV